MAKGNIFQILKEYVSEARYEGNKVGIIDFFRYYKIVREERRNVKSYNPMDITLSCDEQEELFDKALN